MNKTVLFVFLLIFIGLQPLCAQDFEYPQEVPEDTLRKYFSQNFLQFPLDSIANYKMDVKLDTESKKIYGKLHLTWLNTTSFPATDLYFHLYYNAFRNTKSSFLNSARSEGLDLSDFGENDWGYCEIQSIKTVADSLFLEDDLTGKITYEQPDDANPYDRTVLRVPLRRSVFPGESINLKIEWISKIPHPIARTGFIGDYYFIAQWFPKIGVFEQNGMWNCHQFIQTEFYADFGTYDVMLTVPKNWVVGATGRQLARYDSLPDVTTYHFYQNAVHDFAWVTSPVLREFYQQFEVPGLPPVTMRLLLMPYNLDKRERYFKSTAIALEYYGTWYGAYPYGHITIVDPAYQSNSGGMEYPTLFTGGARWLGGPATRQPESVTIHETGHQFWYGMVANNEFEHAWLDEGINTYSQHRIYRQHLSKWPLTHWYLDGFIPLSHQYIYQAERTDGADLFGGMYSDFKRDPIAAPSWQNSPGAYRVNAYNRPALMLQTLENYLGWKTFQQVLSTFFNRFQFRHPTPEDFFSVVNEVSNQDMSWFFEEAYYSSNVFDYAVGEVTTEPVKGLVGYNSDETPVFQQQVASSEKFQTTTYIRRWGEAVFPVEVKFTFENGEEELMRWDGKSRWKKYQFVKEAALQKVEVDPTGKLVLDINSVNNTWVRQSYSTFAAWKWTAKWMIWLQHVLELFVFLV